MVFNVLYCYRKILPTTLFGVLLIAWGCSGRSHPNSQAKTVDSETAHPAQSSRSPQIPAISESNQAIENGMVALSEEQNLDRSIAAMMRRVDSHADQWQVEKFNDAAMRCLRELESIWMTNDSSAVDPVWVAPDFVCRSLRPSQLHEKYQDDRLIVRTSTISNESPKVHSVESPSRLSEELARLCRALPSTEKSSRDIHCKIVRVQFEEDRATSRVLYHAFGRGERGLIEQHATWRMHWANATSAEALKLTQIEVLDYQEVVAGPHGDALFADCTESLFRDEPSFKQQLIYGVDHWRRDLEASLDPDVTGHQGLAIADFNGDGLEDVYVCQQGGLPNRMLIQQPDGKVVDTAASAGVDFLDLCSSALGLDLDNDGDRDLVVAGGTSLVILENDGSGKFRLRFRQELKATAHSLCSADVDLDGFLDLFVCGYSPGKSIWRAGDSLGAPVPYYDANNGGPNSFLKNKGDFAFQDRTTAVGLDQNNRRFSFAAAWEDFDNDGDADLYVANDFGRNNLYRNDGGRFVDIAADSQVEDVSTGMSVSWADYDNDGWMDVYVGNMFSSAGNRIAYQRQFLPQADRETQQQSRRLARGNSLFRGDASGRFVDVSEAAEVTRGRWAWASVFTDLNNDGFEDIVVANGFITHRDSSDL